MPNSLANEKSPYLLQHAENPVDWLPWGEIAFRKAREENKPIFLSVGYSTCHWCHVMERESFENSDTAALLNLHFVPVKVDREERPDVDRLYMNFVQLATQSGGWPMSVWLTPDLKPFYGGTYFPPVDAYGRPGFSTVLTSLARAWNSDRQGIEASAQSSFETLRSYMKVEGAGTFGDSWRTVFRACHAQILESYDRQWGGFGGPPKFPRPVVHDFLHAYAAFSGDQTGIRASAHTLQMMATRGMNDQLGGGFHRYSVDEMWIVSHFEKMLYDQAQIVISLLEAGQINSNQTFFEAAEKTLRYVWRDLAHVDGAFFAAEDADSLEKNGAHHKAEGAFYVWTKREIETMLHPQAARVFCDFYGVKNKGNAPQNGDPHGEFREKNILFEAEPAHSVAKMNGLPLREVLDSLEQSRDLLLEARKKRPRPHRDDKIILAWNGLMISAFARAGTVLANPKWTRIARSAVSFCESELGQGGRWKRHFKDGASDVAAFADDLAALGRAYLDLYDATLETKFIERARVVADQLVEEFWDAQVGGFFSSAADDTILLRGKDDYDGAEPSPSGLAVELFARLFHLLGDAQDFEIAQKTCEAFAQRISGVPSAMPLLLRGKMLLEAPHQHVVIVGELDECTQLLRAARREFAPFRSVILLDEASRAFWREKQEFLRTMNAINGNPTAYICQNFACQKPVQSADEVGKLLSNKTSR